MQKSEYFWHSVEQAAERLSNTVVLYDDIPVYIQAVEAHQDGIPRGYIEDLQNRKAERKMLNSPKFNRFRDLPNLGWVNMMDGTQYGTSLYVERGVRRGTRQHGLNGNNTVVHKLTEAGIVSPTGSNNAMFGIVMRDRGFLATHRNEYPSLTKVLEIVQEGSPLAFGRKWCVATIDGFTYLFRERTRVGIFSGRDTLLLAQKFAYLREELFAEKHFDINNLREL